MTKDPDQKASKPKMMDYLGPNELKLLLLVLDEWILFLKTSLILLRMNRKHLGYAS